MKPHLAWLILGALACNQSFAQSPEPGRQQSVQGARYGTSLGLPRDGNRLYLPDEAYPRFPLPPGKYDSWRQLELRFDSETLPSASLSPKPRK